MTINKQSTRPLKLQKCYEVAFSEDGELLVTLSRDVVGWDVETRSKRFRAHPFSHPSSCAIHPDGSRIVVKNTRGQIALLDAADGTLIRTLNQEKESEGSNIVFSACGAYIIDGSWNGLLTLRSAMTGEISFRREFPGEMIILIARSRSGKQLFVVHQPKAVGNEPPASSYITIWTLPFTAPSGLLKFQKLRINDVAISPDGTRLCLQGRDVITVVRIADGRILGSTTFQSGGSGFAVAWSPDGGEIASVQDGCIVFHCAETMEQLHAVEVKYPSDVSYAPSGKVVALGAWTSGVLIERIHPGQAVQYNAS